MNKEENVIRYYVLCNKLKNIIRTGWTDWHVERERLESVAEHIYGVQMLAIVMNSEYNYDIDIMKVIMMLAVHELEEIYIGDIPVTAKEHKYKDEAGHEAVAKVLSGLIDKDMIYNFVVEFDSKKTKEAKFAFFCDKLECDLQSRLYDEEGCVDLNNQDGNYSMSNPDVIELLGSGMSWSEMWLTFGQRRYNYDDNFMAVSNYAKTHKISKYRDM